MTEYRIPPPVLAVTEIAREVVHAREALEEGRKSGELSEAGIEKRRLALRTAIKKLVAAVKALEADLARLAKRPRPKASSIDWSGMAKAGIAFADLVATVNAGAHGTEVTRKTADFIGTHGPGGKGDIIDAEFEDVPGSRRTR